MNRPEPDNRDLFAIADLAREFGISTRAIRFYEAKGLLNPERVGGTRVFRRRDRARLILILRGKRLGFSLALVQKYLDLYDADPTHKVQLEHLLAGARQRIAELEAQRQDLELTIEELREIEDLTLEALGERLSPARKSPAFQAAEPLKSPPPAQPSKPSKPSQPARKGKKP